MKAVFATRLIALLLAPAFLFAFTTKGGVSNYSGEWKLNESKSELGQFDRFAVRSIKAEQTEASIAITRTQPSFNGDNMTSTETLSFDGKETETTVFESGKRKATAKWSDDGKNLVISYTLNLEFNGDNMTSTETLSFDGKETETTVFESGKRKATAKWSDDGKNLVISYTLNLEFNGQSMEIKGTDTWTVSDDGKTLTVQTNSSSAQGEFSWKAVYDKQ